MSAFSNLALGAGGAVVSPLWKVVAVALAGLLLAVGSSAGTGWWMASAARDQALADLRVEQGINVQLRAGVDDQNRKIQLWYRASEEASARGRAAQQQAEAGGRRYDLALQQVAGAHATNCAEAMPYVNKMLEGVR